VSAEEGKGKVVQLMREHEARAAEACDESERYGELHIRNLWRNGKNFEEKRCRGRGQKVCRRSGFS